MAMDFTLNGIYWLFIFWYWRVGRLARRILWPMKRPNISKVGAWVLGPWWLLDFAWPSLSFKTITRPPSGSISCKRLMRLLQVTKNVRQPIVLVTPSKLRFVFAKSPTEASIFGSRRIAKDLEPWQASGISQSLFKQATSVNRISHYQIINKKLYRRDKDEMFPSRSVH